MAAAVVDLNALPDAVGPAAQDDDLLTLSRSCFVLFVVAAVEIWGIAFKLGRARIPQPPVGARSFTRPPIRFAARRSSSVAASAPSSAMALISSVICFIWFRN